MKADQNSRSASSLRNTIIGTASQLLTIIISFVSRTVFIKLLGAEYLGVNSLYSNILVVLSLAELGIGNVMVFSLYKPIAEKDKVKICAILNYYKKIYRLIAVVVLILGAGVVPYLDKIVNSDLPHVDLVIFYMLFLLNSVVSYFVIYKSALINADQKIYIINIYRTIFILVQHTIQIILLIITRNYMFFLYAQVVCTILVNMFISYKANKMYPFIKNKVECLEIDKATIKENIKSTFMYKFGVVVMNNTDNILISMILGTIYVGYYSNYSLLITTVTTFINILIYSLSASLGNLNASGDLRKSYNVFNSLLLFFHWLSAFCSLCFLLVFNDFIVIWIGKEYLLSSNIMFAIVFNFYLQNAINPVWMYRETMGMFNQIKYTMIFASVINLAFSVVLGFQFGMAGILIATALGRILTTVWYEPRLLYHTKFKKPVMEYWIRQFKYCLVSIVAMCITMIICNKLPVSLPFVLIKLFISFTVISIAFIVTNFNSEEFKMLRKYALIFRGILTR